MGDKRIKLSYPTVTQTSSIIEETLYSAITRNRLQKTEPGKRFCCSDNELLGYNQIKLSSPTVTKLHQLFKKSFTQQSLATASGNHFQENHCSELNVDYIEMQITCSLFLQTENHHTPILNTGKASCYWERVNFNHAGSLIFLTLYDKSSCL